MTNDDKDINSWAALGRRVDS